MPQEFYTDGSPSRTEIEYVDGPLTRFADDATIAELERQARRIAELEAALRMIADGYRSSDDGRPQASRFSRIARNALTK